MCEDAATINTRGDEHYLFRPCWLQPPAVASNIHIDPPLLLCEQESNHPIKMKEKFLVCNDRIIYILM